MTARLPTEIVLDVSKLKEGDTIENRYRYIEKIGKGAFGTVVLVEDEVVDEQLILKFLNANVSSDEEMMQRFRARTQILQEKSPIRTSFGFMISSA